MEWESLTMPCGEVAEGEFWAYLVVVESARVGVVLTRVRKGHLAPPVLFPLATAGDGARNAVFFPLGRGPGRPGGEPELAALMESAKVYAERYEMGENLEGYPAWQQYERFPKLAEGETMRFAAGQPPEFRLHRYLGPGLVDGDSRDALPEGGTADPRKLVCPDGGTCHHLCQTAACFRVLGCGPLSGVFPDDRWPDAIYREALKADRPTGGSDDCPSC